MKVGNKKTLNMDAIVVEVGADQTGGLTTLCIKIGYSSREPRRVVLPCIKIGYVSAMYKDMEPTQCIKIGGNVLRYGAESRKPTQCIKICDLCIKIGDACIKIGRRLNVLRYGADSMY